MAAAVRLSVQRIKWGAWKQRVTALRRVPSQPEPGCWQKSKSLSAHGAGGAAPDSAATERLPGKALRAHRAVAGGGGRATVRASCAQALCWREGACWGAGGPRDLGADSEAAQGRAGCRGGTVAQGHTLQPSVSNTLEQWAALS